MADQFAKETMAEYNRELQKQSNIRNLWQRTADHMYPYVQITSEFSAGTDRTQMIYDMTPMLDMLDMVSGFKQVLIPAGQTFFEIRVDDSLGRVDAVQRYISYLTQKAHDALFKSNFMTQFDQVLISGITFGPMCMYSEWRKGKGLNFKSSKIGSYVIFEDDSENVIGSIHRFKLSARSAYDLYGEKAGEKVLKAADSAEHQWDEFWFLYKIMPRKVDPKRPRTFNKNMPYGAWLINEADCVTVEESGYHENPYATARWMRPEYEKDGRGIGTEMLPQIKVLFEMTKDFLTCGGKWADPPKQALSDSVEGEIRTGKGAITWVNQLDALKSQDSGMNGNFPITEKILLYQTEIIDRAFFKRAFDPLSDLTGDRRTRLEIQERIRGTLKKLGPPVNRIWYELLTKVIERSVLELIRNREVSPPPAELAGVNFGIDYVGPLALALKSEQAAGFVEWASAIGELNIAFPDAHVDDNIDFDDAIPRMGRTFGVNVEDMATAEERDAKRQARQQAAEQQQMLMAAEAGSKAYKNASGTPEKGSPAEALIGAA